MRFLPATVLMLILVACGSRLATYSGTIHTEAVDVGSKTGGRVVVVLVSAGDSVRASQVLVRIDDGTQRALLDQSQAKLQQARAGLADLVAGARPAEIARASAQTAQNRAAYSKVSIAQEPQIAAAVADVRDAQAAQTLAQKTYNRQQSLSTTGDVSRQSVDDARANLSRTQQRSARAQAVLAQIQNAQAPYDPAAAAAALGAAAANETLVRSGSRPQEVVQARAAIDAAAAAVAGAQTALAETVIRAPHDGVIESIDLHPGDILAPGAIAATLDTLQNPYVRIFVPQQQLAPFARGARVTVRSDALAGQTFEGIDIERDRTAQFTPRDVQTSEDRAELTFGIKIRIDDPKHQLFGGTTVTVSRP